MATGPALTPKVPKLASRMGRPAGAWAALAAGPGLILAGGLAFAGPGPTSGDIGTVPSAAAESAGPGDVRAAPGPDQDAQAPSFPPVDGRSSAVAPPARPAAPVRLELPRFAISARIEPVGVDASGALGVPEDPDVLGWWRSAARPGQGSGAIVVDGHVDSARHGLGVFAKLAELDPGDRVEIGTGSGATRRYVVSGRRLYPKASLPTGQVFAQQGPERLVLISCGGTFDDRLRKYSHNVVVYAVPSDEQSGRRDRHGDRPSSTLDETRGERRER